MRTTLKILKWGGIGVGALIALSMILGTIATITDSGDSETVAATTTAPVVTAAPMTTPVTTTLPTPTTTKLTTPPSTSPFLTGMEQDCYNLFGKAADLSEQEFISAKTLVPADFQSVMTSCREMRSAVIAVCGFFPSTEEAIASYKDFTTETPGSEQFLTQIAAFRTWC